MIDCYDYAKQRFDWWPDWRGQTVVLIASGHSAKEFDPSIVNCKVAVVGENFALAPNADAIYSCDENWWYYRKGLPEFKGLKITQARNVCNKWPEIKRIEVQIGSFFKTKPGHVSSYGNSGAQLYNLIAQFGVSKIILSGYDMGSNGVPHWYGKNKWEGASNPKEQNFARWRAAMDSTARRVQELGISVINVGSCSTLSAFPKMTLSEALAA